MIGLIKPSAGSILVNGNDIKNSTEEWQNFISYVPQNSFLINDTIKKNIILSDESNTDDDLKILQAIKISIKVVLPDPDSPEIPIKLLFKNSQLTSFKIIFSESG